MRALFKNIRLGYCIAGVLSGAFLAFGMYNVHSAADITEGGILGLTLLLEHWLSLSPAISGFVMNSACYIFGWKTLGKEFIIYSSVSAFAFSASYRVCEIFPPLWPQLYNYPVLAAVIGAVFVGVGVGVCVRIGGAPSGDDALAMSLSKLFGLKLQWVYLISDLLVLGLSLTYIPFNRIIFSLLTVVLSGQIIGYIQRLSFFEK